MTKKFNPVSQIRRTKKATNNRHGGRRLVVSANISEYRVRQILDCYTQWMTIQEAASRLNISHVTIGRIFTLARERLIAADVFTTIADWKQMQYDIENEGGPYFDEDRFDREIKMLVDKRRGVSGRHRPLYEAEALFRLQHPELSSAKFLQRLLLVIRDTGPLDRPPRRRASVSALEQSFHAVTRDFIETILTSIEDVILDKDREDKELLLTSMIRLGINMEELDRQMLAFSKRYNRTTADDFSSR